MEEQQNIPNQSTEQPQSQQPTQPHQPMKSQLPTTLLVLAIMSLVAIGMTSLYDLMLMAVSNVPEEQFEAAMAQSQSNFEMYGLDKDAVDMNSIYKMIANGKYHLLFNIVELIGVVLLLKRNRSGVHFYIASQIGIGFIAYMTMGAGALLQIFFCVFFAFLYWRASALVANDD